MDKLRKQKGKASAEHKASASAPSTSKPINLRMQIDMNKLPTKEDMPELELQEWDGGSIVKLWLSPVRGYWSGGKYEFTIDASDCYPYKAPIVKCNTLIYHPNINFEGKICLNILREEWKPIHSISTIINGLLFLFECPSADDPLQVEIGALMANDMAKFEKNVSNSMRGRNIKMEDGTTRTGFTRFIKDGGWY